MLDYVESQQRLATSLEAVLLAAGKMHDAKIAPVALGELITAAAVIARQLSNALDIVNLPDGGAQ